MPKFKPGDKAYLFGILVTILEPAKPRKGYPADLEWYRFLLPQNRGRVASEKVLLTREEEVASRLRGD